MKRPKLDYLHWKKAKGRFYARFNTGKEANGKLITIPLGRLDRDLDAILAKYRTLLGHRNRSPKHITTVAKLVDHFDKLIDGSKRATSTKRVYSLYSAKIREAFADFPADDVHRHDVSLWLETFPTTGARKMARGVL